MKLHCIHFIRSFTMYGNNYRTTIIVVFNFIARGQILPLWLHCIQFMIDLLAGLSGPQHLTFALGQLENLSSFIQIIIMLGSLQAVI